MNYASIDPRTLVVVVVALSLLSCGPKGRQIANIDISSGTGELRFASQLRPQRIEVLLDVRSAAEIQMQDFNRRLQESQLTVIATDSTGRRHTHHCDAAGSSQESDSNRARLRRPYVQGVWTDCGIQSSSPLAQINVSMTWAAGLQIRRAAIRLYAE